jgi:hypothetical protein
MHIGISSARGRLSALASVALRLIGAACAVHDVATRIERPEPPVPDQAPDQDGRLIIVSIHVR